MTTKLSDIIDAAADHMERVGFYKGDYFKGGNSNPDIGDTELTVKRRRQILKDFRDAPCCSYGALYQAAPNKRVVGTAGRAIASRLPDGYYSDLVDWNDATSRRKHQVLALFRRTAQELREEGK